MNDVVKQVWCHVEGNRFKEFDSVLFPDSIIAANSQHMKTPTCLDLNLCKNGQKSAITAAFLALNLGRLSGRVSFLDALVQNVNRNKCRFSHGVHSAHSALGWSICTNMNLCG